ncbi:MAG: DUF262 domain-containing protein, partial [Oxalobacteraceae bacterium]
MPRDPSRPFNTPSDQAYVALGAREAGQRWFAFDQPMPAARRGEATRFVMAVWNAPHSPDAPKFSSEAPDLGGQPPVHWYRVPRTRNGVKERNRTSLWNGIRIALRHGMPMHAMLKDHETHRCALQHVYEIAHVHYPVDGEALWLGLNPVDSDAPVRAGAAGRVPVATDHRIQAPAGSDTEEECVDWDEPPPSDMDADVPLQELEEKVSGAADPSPSAAALAGATSDDAAAFDPPPDVRAEVHNMPDLFAHHAWPLALDTYQRGFVWGEDKVNQLIADLLEYQAAPSPKPPYYMGTVLVHEHAGRQQRFVVDGQQRLTALSVLYHAVTGALPGHCLFRYSPQSAAYIQAAAKACRVVAPMAGQPSALGPDVFRQICFTVVSVRRLDLAFTFFDTQNNRGVQLHATDLLKAFHLRAIDGETEAQQTLQRRCAARWEALQRGKQVLTHRQERVQTLFARLLWRARRWTGQHAWEAGHGALLEEFEGPAWARLPRGQADRVPLYAARTNLRARALTWADDDSVHYEDQPASPFTNADELPFAIRQPIHPGASFFLYADRYAALLARLTDHESTDPEVLGFREILNTMVAKNSLFLQEAFLLVGLMYADRFGSERLEEFALWLEHALGAVRMAKLQVRQETAQKFFREDSRMSLPDVVANAYHPQQAIDHVRSMADGSYDTAVIDMDGGGVQAVYQ